MQRDLEARPCGQPFQHPVLLGLFLEHDWSKHSRRLLSERQALGKPIWFDLEETTDHEEGRLVGGPHLLVHYPQLCPGDPVKCWMPRSWRECVRSKSVLMFEKKVKGDMRGWCQAQFAEHRGHFPMCEDCGQPACVIQHVRPRFDEIVDTVLRRARSQYNDATMPMPWFTASRHFGPDYPDGFREEFLAESGRARLRSLCNSCCGKPTYWRQPYHAELAQLEADAEELTRLFKERAERRHHPANVRNP